MGGGKHKTHESFTVTPADQAIVASTVDSPGAAGEGEVADGPTTPEWLTEAAGAIATATDYEAMCAATAAAQAQAATADGPEAEAATKAIHQAAAAWLTHQPPDVLQALASQAGFAHPTLVGLSGTENHPLCHWLDPSYPADSVSKAKIAAKADDRYTQLQAGQTIAGLTVADVDAAEAALPGPPAGPPDGTWQATPGQVIAAQAALAEHLVELQTPQHPADRAAALTKVISAENQLATATCPEAPEALTGAQAAATVAVNHALGNPTITTPPVVAPLAAQAVEASTLPVGADQVVTASEALSLLRASTSPTERDALLSTVADRHAQLASLTQLSEDLHGPVPEPSTAALSLGGLVEPSAQDNLADFAANASSYYETQSQVNTWAGTSLLGFHHPSLHPPALPAPATLTTQFRAWAKTQPVGQLRAAATAMGMEHASSATRAQVQNWVAASWDPGLDKTTIGAAVAAKATGPKPVPAKPATTTSAEPATSGPSDPPATPAGPATGRTFSTKHLALVEALKAHNAAMGSLPARLPATEVGSWTFTPAPGKPLGGMHTKSLHHAPDGTVWMFKADSTKGGRAPAEEAASAIFAHVGVPSVPVYAHTIGGKAGTVQPLLSGATNLSTSPSSWSQADIDALVRCHVAAWAVGDHDGKADNLLRTSGGGIVPVDQGQAFKFFGQDKLSSSYHPNGSYGASQAVFHQAYQAAKTGHLGPGVTIRPEAALPVIKAFEALPDSTYRAMLTATATAGAAHKVHWYDTMRARAAKRLGTPAVTDHDVAEEFLDYAVTRKTQLRASFAKFFADEGFAGAAKITQVA